MQYAKPFGILKLHSSLSSNLLIALGSLQLSSLSSVGREVAKNKSVLQENEENDLSNNKNYGSVFLAASVFITDTCNSKIAQII